MSVKAKIKSLKKGVNAGDLVPQSQLNGNNGRYFEKLLANNGHFISNGKGVDMPDQNVEIKTRKSNSTSYHTVGSITLEDIINLPYNQTHLFKKLQSQYRVKYNDEFLVVTDASIYDFSDLVIQDKIEKAYEICRKKVIAGNISDWISGSPFGNLEKQNANSWKFRISSNGMKILENMAKSTFNKHFTFI